MTVALDRLERAGNARRVRDGTDRRRVLVELTPELAAHASGFYSKHQAEAERLYQRYNVDQMELLLEFVRNGRQFNEQEAALLEQENRLAKGKRGSRL
jgi:DNA-binding MarR family transcriptional regulator